MTWRLVVPYTAVLGWTLQSVKWHHSMQEHLVQMAEHATQATQWQETAAGNKAMAETEQAHSVADQAEGDAMVAQGEVLLSQGQSHQEIAMNEQVEAEAIAAKATAEQAEAVVDLDAAAADQVAAEEQVAQATADAAFAAQSGVEATQEQVAVGVCEFVPVLDIVCDVVGGAAAIGLETRAAGEAARAAQEYAQAAAMQLAEDALVTQGTEMQAQAAEDETEAAGLEATAAELETKALAEVAKGEEEQAAGEEKIAQSEAEQAAAEEETAQAAAEQETAGVYWGKSLMSGASAFRDAVLAGITSVIALGFFATRLVASFLIPGLLSAHSIVTLPVTEKQQLRATWFPSVTRLFGQTLIHCFVMGLVAAHVFHDVLPALNQADTDMRDRGSIILGFSAVCAIVQSTLLHCHSNPLVRAQPCWRSRLAAVGTELVRCFVIFWVLFVLEVLFLLVNVGPSTIVSPKMMQFLQQWYIWAAFGILLLFHFAFFDRREWNRTEAPQQTDADGEIETRHLLSGGDEACDGETNYGSTDTDKLLVDVETSKTPTDTTPPHPQPLLGFVPFARRLWSDAKRLLLPLELLLATCMLAVLVQCLPNAQGLWRASRPVILSIVPYWQLAVFATLVLVTCVLFAFMPRKKDPVV